jgi:hypothetical protein
MEEVIRELAPTKVLGRTPEAAATASLVRGLRQGWR